MSMPAPVLSRSLPWPGLLRKALPVLAVACVVTGLTLGCGPAAATPAPTITAFSPASGPVETTTVTVTGSGFSAGVNSLTVGGVASTEGAVASDTSVTFTVPAAAVTGAIVVNTPNGSASTAANFIVVPAITSVTTPLNDSTPTGSASGGTVVTINGSGLEGITGVSFVGPDKVSTVAVTMTSQTALLITVAVPANAPLGAGTLVLTINADYGLTPATVTSPFTVTE